MSSKTETITEVLANSKVPDEGLRKLVTQWRHNAQGCGQRDQCAAGTWRSCARELEGVLAAAQQPAGEAMTWTNPAPHASAPREPSRNASYPVAFRLGSDFYNRAERPRSKS